MVFLLVQGPKLIRETRGVVLMLKTVNVQSVGRQMFMPMHAFFDLAPVNLADSGDPSAGARLAGGLHGHTKRL